MWQNIHRLGIITSDDELRKYENFSKLEGQIYDVIINFERGNM